MRFASDSFAPIDNWIMIGFWKFRRIRKKLFFFLFFLKFQNLEFFVILLLVESYVIFFYIIVRKDYKFINYV